MREFIDTYAVRGQPADGRERLQEYRSSSRGAVAIAIVIVIAIEI